FRTTVVSRGFMTSSGPPIRIGELVRNLLDALKFPKQVTVVKCTSHHSGGDHVTL
ncbi:hypothetical protein NDU88_006746, partial [Pleurodeles waltl]